MNKCAVCSRGEQVARIVNELLFAKVQLREIERLTGIGFRTVHRHSHGKRCQFSYQEYRGSLVKTKKNQRGELTFVEWPDGSTNRLPAPFHYEGELRDAPGVNDLILQVVFDAPPEHLPHF